MMCMPVIPALGTLNREDHLTSTAQHRPGLHSNHILEKTKKMRRNNYSETSYFCKCYLNMCHCVNLLPEPLFQDLTKEPVQVQDLDCHLSAARSMCLLSPATVSFPISSHGDVIASDVAASALIEFCEKRSNNKLKSVSRRSLFHLEDHIKGYRASKADPRFNRQRTSPHLATPMLYDLGLDVLSLWSFYSFQMVTLESGLSVLLLRFIYVRLKQVKLLSIGPNS